MENTNLTGMSLHELERFAESLGEKKFRGRQLFSWIYEKRANSFSEMTNLAKPLREKLERDAAVGHLELVEKTESKHTGTHKFLFRLRDEHLVESVYIPDEDRRTLCISSQVGCALNCAFCATAKLKFKRNLDAGEIVDQVLFVERDLGIELTNIVFMGMGEPFMNYENVIRAAHLINHPDGIGIGTRHIVISTAGVVKNIYRYADEGHKYRLAVSLNSPYDDERQSIMPVAKKWNMEELINAVRYYTKRSKQILTFEYVLFDGLNDTPEHATALKKLVSPLNCKLNLIPYNSVLDQFKRPSAKRMELFMQQLHPLNAPVSVRWSKGDDINAACGQLAGKYKKSG